MKFLVPNYSCLQNPVVSVLCRQLNLLNPPPKKKVPGYATAGNYPEESIQHSEHGESFKSKMQMAWCYCLPLPTLSALS